MRIAISGSHATGKSTLVRELADRHRNVTVVEEPYYLLADEGYLFSDPPTADDFEVLLDRSISLVAADRSGDVVFDRAPADYLAYLTAVSRGVSDRGRVVRVAQAMATLDLVVFVPIEEPDRLDVTDSPKLRRRVDGLLREMLVDGGWGFAAPVVEVNGTPQQRAEQVRESWGALR